MTKITELAPMLQTLLTDKANELAHSSGFIKRQRKLTGAQFVQTLVFSHLAHPMSTYRQIHQRAIMLGQTLSMQAIDKRLKRETTGEFLLAMVNASLKLMVEGASPRLILPHFHGVYVTDGSILKIGNTRRKLGAMLELQTGTLQLCLTDEKSNDHRLPDLLPQPKSNELHLRDLGFFNLKTFQQWNKNTIYWLSRHHLQAKLYDQETGHELSLDKLPLDTPFCRPVLVGAMRVHAYLIGQATPPEAVAKRQKRFHRQAQLEQAPISHQRQLFSAWTLYLTNIPDLSFDQAHTLARLRWQIELLFKLWKYHGALEKSPSKLPQRNVCLTYAKLLAVILQHWILIVTGWHHAQQSWVYNAALIRDQVSKFQSLFLNLRDLIDYLTELSAVFERAFRLSKRAKNPLTFQLLDDYFP